MTKFKLIQAFIVVLLICKNEDDQFNFESTIVVTTDLQSYVYGDFSRRSRAANSTVQCLTGRIISLPEILWLLLLPARMKKIQSKMKALACHYNIHQFLRCLMAANSIIGDGIFMKFKLIQAFIVALLICKNENDQFKIESTRVVTTDLPLYVYGDFSRHSRAANSTVQGMTWPNFKRIRNFMVVLVTCKNEKDPTTNKRARVATRLFIYFF